MAEIYDLIIIGGGPSGLTAGLYAVRGGLNAVMIEKGIIGGQVVTTADVENYPGFPEPILGPELVERMEKQAARFGLKTRTMCEASKIEIKDHLFLVEICDQKDSPLIARSVILANGNSPRLLGAAGEEKLRGRGVSYCATCDGALYRNREIVVVGGGDSALTEALFLTTYASRIHLVHRRDKFRGEKTYADRVLSHPKINVIWNSVVSSINGSDFVESVTVKNLQNSEEKTIPVDGIFIFVGLTPNTQIVKNSPHISAILSEDGYINSDQACKTKIEGLFAAGDARSGNFKQIVVACADGAIAYQSAYHYIDAFKNK